MRGLSAKYDAAQTNDENRKHWAQADGLSASAANTLGVRQLLRNRSRYECANNCYASGMVRTMAYHCVGSGPTLQIDSGDEAVDAAIEREWSRWSNEVDLAAKLRTMREARARDGESFAILTTNEKLRHQVKLSLRLVECDQVSNPVGNHLLTPNYIDGVHFDDAGNPEAYDVLARHPGDAWQWSTVPLLGDKPTPADKVIHWFREDRPGQVRGIPEITPALPLYAILRRYTLATLGSAETAAMVAMFLKTNSSAIQPAETDAWDTLSLTRNAMMILPDGWEPSQFKAEQPTTTYDVFVRAVIREIARCIDMPYNVAAGDSSDSSYASGRLDHQTWRRAVDIDRHSLERVALDRILAAWLDEAIFVPGLLNGLPPLANLRHEWHWTPFEHVDPNKEANAATTLLEAGLLAIPTYYASQGKKWQDEMAKQAMALGMTLEEYRVELRKKFFANGQQQQANGVAAAVRSLVAQLEDNANAA